MCLATGMQVSSFSQPEWAAACAEWERRMAPLEQRVSSRLREHFGAGCTVYVCGGG
jgi:dynein heavy chain 2, cytosolic